MSMRINSAGPDAATPSEASSRAQGNGTAKPADSMRSFRVAKPNTENLPLSTDVRVPTGGASETWKSFANGSNTPVSARVNKALTDRDIAEHERLVHNFHINDDIVIRDCHGNVLYVIENPKYASGAMHEGWNDSFLALVMTGVTASDLAFGDVCPPAPKKAQ